MKKFLAMTAVACSLSLFVWAGPALAQHHSGGGHGGGGHGGGGFHGGASHGGGFHGGSVSHGGFHGGSGYRGGYGHYGYGGRGWPGYYGGALYPYGYSYWPYSNYAYSYPNYDYAPNYYEDYDSPIYSVPSLSTDSTVTPPVSNAPLASAAAATIHVLVPDPNASVYFEDTLTKQTGTDRAYVTPTLPMNGSYVYTIRATWMENGQMMSRSKEVAIHAGSDATVDFRVPS
jgi:uncharacterized protein (TIGR03000 family)